MHLSPWAGDCKLILLQLQGQHREGFSRWMQWEDQGWEESRIWTTSVLSDHCWHLTSHPQGFSTDHKLRRKRQTCAFLFVRAPHCVYACLCERRKDGQKLLQSSVDKWTNSTHLKVAARTQATYEGQMFVKSWAARLTAAFCQREKNWRMKMRCQ